MQKHIYSALILVLFLFVGCAKEGPEGKNSLIDLVLETPSANCSTGGYKVVSGIDQNKNNVLDADEIQSTKYICNGADGVNGNNSLVSLVPQTAGPNCPTGGYILNTGIDANKNGVLDPSEIANSQYVCNGMTGNNSLLSLVAEPAGPNCPNGGYKVNSGIDVNKNGTLDIAETQSTTYICNGKSALTSLMAEPSGSNCPTGGFRLNTGIDVNGNGTLETSEITNSQFVCNGRAGNDGNNGSNGNDGSNGINSLVSMVAEPAGANCPNGGYKVNSGLDVNKNGILEQSEIQNSNYICNGSGSVSYLISVKAEAAGSNCTTGGYSFNTGADLNRNGILDANEISETTYICNSSSSSTAPALKNMVYVGGLAGFYALNALNGTEIWKYSNSRGFAYSMPLIHESKVYTGGTDGNMYAFDASNGEVKWMYYTDNSGIGSGPAIADGIIYFGSNDDNFYALNANTGQFIWKYATGENVSTKPIVLNGIVYFGSSDSYVYALNAATGALVWRYKTGAMINQSNPAIHNDVLFVGSRDGYLYAINISNGTLKWRYYGGGPSLEYSSPHLYNGLVYIGGGFNVSVDNKGALYAVNQLTGSLAWAALDNVGVSADPVANNNKVIVSAGNFVYAINAQNGEKVWENEILPNSAGITVAGGFAFVGGGGTNGFYALSESTGVRQWKAPITSLMFSTPTVIDSDGNIVQN